MADKLLEALERAEKVWKAAQVLNNKEKFIEAEALHAYGIFSFNQLAKICRTNVPYLTRRLPKQHTVGGRFEPEALSVLIILRRAVLTGEYVGDSLFKIAERAGCSINCIRTLTGAPSYRLYQRPRVLGDKKKHRST